jgi:hypothetical protein
MGRRLVASPEVTRSVAVLPGGRRLLGHALEFGRDPLALFEASRQHGDVVRIRFGPFLVYVLNSPDAIRQALVSQARKLEKEHPRLGLLPAGPAPGDRRTA